LKKGELLPETTRNWLGIKKERAEQTHRKVFDLLKGGGYERVEVEYEGDRELYWVEEMRFYKAGAEVDAEEVPAEVSDGTLRAAADRWVGRTQPPT
jgi:hypothetical protein